MQEFWARNEITPNKLDMQICYQLLLPKSLMNVGTSTSILTAVKVCFINGPTLATFCLLPVFSNKKYNFYNK